MKHSLRRPLSLIVLLLACLTLTPLVRPCQNPARVLHCGMGNPPYSVLRTVSALELSEMPDGTIYAETGHPDALCQKVEGMNFVGSDGKPKIDWLELYLWPFPLNDSAEDSHELFVFGGMTSRWALYDETIEFYVLDKDALAHLSDAVARALSVTEK